MQLQNGNAIWALRQMALWPPKLEQVPGLRFAKLMGSGKGLVFSLMPDWGRYALLAVWESAAAADAFLMGPSPFSEYRAHCSETWTVKLLPYKSHGTWDRLAPFQPLQSPGLPAEPVAVLTRAAIRWRSLVPFWRNAAHTRDALTQAPGLVAAIGVGELPFVRQATFSIWESTLAMQQYAYQNADHKDVIKRTRQGKWYHEELFARFRVVSAAGTWGGADPLQQLAQPLTATASPGPGGWTGQ